MSVGVILLQDSGQEDPVTTKIMRSYTPQAKFCLKSYSKHLLIDFCDPEFTSNSSRQNRFQQLKKDQKVCN